MKTLSLLLAIPLAVACNKTKPSPVTANPVTPTENVAAVEPGGFTQVVGKLEFKEKCPERPAQSCLVITGGGDLNDTQIYEIPEGKTNFEKVADDENLKRFKIHLEGEATTEVNDNQHVMLMAKVDPPSATGSQRIEEIQSLSVMEK